MSKELEALNYLVNLAVVGNKETNREKVFTSEEIIFPALKRNEPMKVAYEKNGVSYCPVCHLSYLRNAMGNENHYCGNCGQKLDWTK